ncbi:MAG: hypothetical protein IT371_16865 [Deltaproteobacteria bacterium]|nr:hypothetical protein [Deltaproteobacteria bacterium]
MEHNPYAPPVETASSHLAPPPTEPGGLSLSAHGWEIVSSMARWMRIVSTLQYVFGGLLLAGAAIATCAGGSVRLGGARMGALAMGVGFLVLLAVLLFLGATWLRRAALHFYDGVLSDAQSPLASGFRHLRLYLIMYGLFGVLGLAGTIVKLAMGAR